jgi:hypothetical protein
MIKWGKVVLKATFIAESPSVVYVMFYRDRNRVAQPPASGPTFLRRGSASDLSAAQPEG